MSTKGLYTATDIYILLGCKLLYELREIHLLQGHNAALP